MNPSTAPGQGSGCGADTTTDADIVDNLRRSIAEGTLPLGSRLPTRRTLATNHAVSTSTIARSLRRLRNDGYLQPDRGCATYIVERPPPEFRARVLNALATAEPLNLADAAALELLLQERFGRVAGANDGAVDDRLPA